MSSRDSSLKAIRLDLISNTIKTDMSSEEYFQNSVLRPLIKFQNDLLIAAFLNFSNKYKNVFFELSTEKKIIYIPDFLTNRMGIVNCANEQYGFISDDSVVNLHFGREWEFSIYNMAKNVLTESAKMRVSTNVIAQKMADELSKICHPLFGHRGEKIIEDLVKNSWESYR